MRQAYISPDWTENGPRRISYLWHCRACDYEFEAVAFYDASRPSQEERGCRFLREKAPAGDWPGPFRCQVGNDQTRRECNFKVTTMDLEARSLTELNATDLPPVRRLSAEADSTTDNLCLSAANSLAVAHSSLALELIGFHRTAARWACGKIKRVDASLEAA